MFFSPLYLIVMLLGAGITLWAQWKVQSTYKKYAQVRNARNMTGLDVARTLMRNEGLDYVRIEQIGGELTDHYDPRAKAMRLSAGSIAHPSVAAMAVVAHELGHALQDRQGYAWLRLRSGIVGIVNVGSQLGGVLLMVGLVLGAFSRAGLALAWIGVLLMSGGAIFSLVTLPVEFDASARARAMLERYGLVTRQEADGVKAVLDAAALTYVAAAATAILQMLYYVSLLMRRR
ncbi:zinc metallopeptidase [Roseiflexus sp.]|uniref:zinc metallopeptidase n=1 Tax=Roseiflexus sp. TaxID=2562120 RepID=UPI00398AFDDE